MQVFEIPVLNTYNEYFQPEIPELKEGKYIQILILRETKSYSIFTIDKKNLHIERLPAGIENSNIIDRAVIYNLKQSLPERLTGRALLRQFGLNSPEMQKCKIIKKACGLCPDCILYGFNPSWKNETDLHQYRVIIDSGFLVRDISQVMRNIEFNVVSDDILIQSENLMPEVFIPSVETLVDITKEEFVYVMGNILKTTRYGLGDSGNSFIRNHIIGIYFSDVEIFSNLEMSQVFYDKLSIDSSVPDNLTLQDFYNNLVLVANEFIKKSVGRITMLAEDEISDLIHDISVIYSHQDYLRDFINSFSNISSNYIHQHNI
ncbi:type I-D CRISPR-associated protein Cas7/Csc2 [Candidatus Poribacteria bacterium]|nr:type I-D CRISPR-associated protein Cas7/Csc2 [Candidatus Poribacteria bacterium]